MFALSKRKRAVFSAVVMAALLCFGGLLVGCSSQSDESDAPKELTAGSTAYFYAETMDPANNWDGWEMQYFGITENLLKLNDEFGTESWLATSCEQVDEKTWKLELRDDVNFSNGEKMTAEAVKKCFERTYDKNSRAKETLDIASIKAEGQTLTIVTKELVPTFKNIICDPVFSVYYVGKDVKYKKNTPCTGPYQVEEFVFEDHITMQPNQNYWDGQPKLSKVTLKTYFDESSQAMAMQNGELQVLAMPDASAFQTLADESTYEQLKKTSTRADFVRFNMKDKVAANDAVRLAVSYCINREGYADTICGGLEVPSYGVYSAQLPYGGTDGLDVTVDSFNVDAAKEALDKAGVVDKDNDGIRELPDGTPCVLKLYNCSAYERFVKLADDLQSQLKKAGIKLKITTVDYWQDATTYGKDNPGMTIESYGMAPTGDAGYFASMCFKSDGSNNFGSYKNAKVDSLVEKLGKTFDESERTSLIKEMSQEVLDDNAYIFFSNSMTSYITDKSVKDVAVAPSEYYFITKDTAIE